MNEPILTAIDSEETRISVARRHLDSAETWLRHIVNFEMSRKHGPDYFREGIINSKIRGAVGGRMAADPSRFKRQIDATTLEHLIDIATNPEHFKLFKRAFSLCYPLGSAEARQFLVHLADVRNSVQHLNGCSSRQLERVVCYTNDLIESLSAYFVEENQEKMFNAPTILRWTDNFGNGGHSEEKAIQTRGQDFPTKTDLRPGDRLVIEVTVDPAFSEADYTVTWAQPRGYHSDKSFLESKPPITGCKFDYVLTPVDVGMTFLVEATLTSTKAWHRWSYWDDRLTISYRVLPPLE